MFALSQYYAGSSVKEGRFGIFNCCILWECSLDEGLMARLKKLSRDPLSANELFEILNGFKCIELSIFPDLPVVSFALTQDSCYFSLTNNCI